MRPRTTPEQKAEVIYRFFNNVDKRITTIAQEVNLNCHTTNVIINEYLKNSMKNKENFVILPSKMNFE